jgi:hypothetical protein
MQELSIPGNPAYDMGGRGYFKSPGTGCTTIQWNSEDNWD